MKKNLFKKIFGLCVMMIAVLALVACGGGKEKIEFSFETNTLTVEVGQEFTLNTVLSGATSEVEFSFDKEGFVEYKDGKFVALKDGTVTVTGTLKDFKEYSATATITINKKPITATVTLTAEKTTGYVGENVPVTANVTGDIENKKVVYTVDNDNARYAAGVVYLAKAGKAVLKAALEADPTVFATVEFTINEVPASITLSPAATKIGVGATTNVGAVCVPPESTLVWTSSNEAVATVANGVVTGVSAGKATIRATIEGKDAYDEFEIEVLKLVTSITATYEAQMDAYTEQQLVITVAPEDASDKTYTITSSNEEAIMANADGSLTAVGGGVAKITITANDGSGVKFEFEVTVIEEIVEYDAVLFDPAVGELSSGDEYEYKGVTYIVNQNAFSTLAKAIEVTTNKVYVAKGTYSNLVIEKDGIELIGPNAGVDAATMTRLDEAVFDGTIEIAAGTKDVKITGFAFTGAGGIDCKDGCENIEVSYNYVYDTNAATTEWQEARVELEAVFDFWFTSGSEGKNIKFLNNTFNNIDEPGIFVARAINVTANNNVFHNFKKDAIRVDGGYNYGTWEFDSNEFVNETQQGYNGIYLQSVSGATDELGVQTITITNNKFENIGVENASSYICAIGARTYQEQGLKANIMYNTFKNCVNYINFRNNGASADNFELNINYNKFDGIPTGVYHRNIRPGSSDTASSNPVLANLDYNLFLDNEGAVITDLTSLSEKFVDVKSLKDNFQTKEDYEAKLKELTGVDYDYVVNAAWKDVTEGTKVEAEGFTWTFGTNAFASISACLAKLEAGTTIKVLAGMYDETITISLDNVSLVGPNAGVNARYINRFAEAVLLQPININANINNFSLDGFELQGAAAINPGKDADGVTMKYCVLNGTSQDGVIRSSAAEGGEFVHNVKFIGNYSNNYSAWRVLHLTACDGLEASNNYIECTGGAFDFLNVQYRLDGNVVIKDNTFIKSSQSFLYVKAVGQVNATIQGNYIKDVLCTAIDFRDLKVPGSNNTFTIINNTFVNSGSDWCPVRIRTAGYAAGDSITINCNYNLFIDSYYNDEGQLTFVENPSFGSQVDPFKVIYNMDYNYYEVEGEAYTNITADSFTGAAISWENTYTNKEDMPEYTVDTEVKPTSVEITNKIETMNAYETYQITFKVGPDDATNKKVGFASSNTAAATVSSAGLINAKSGGTTTITVFSMADSTILDTMTIVVSPKSRIELRVDGNGVLVVGGEKATATIEATYYGEDTTQLSFTSSDPAIATVSESGVVTAVAAGTVTITATQADKTASVTFTVVAEELTGILKVLADGNHATIWNQNIVYIGSDDGSADYLHNIYGSANDYYAGNIPSVTRNMLATSAPNNENTEMESLEFIVVHDTAGSPSTSTAYANSHWCTNPTNTGSSWHYTIGNDGIFQQMEDNMVAWHAGDGTSWGTSTTLNDTGVAYEGDRPTVTIGDDNYFYINGKKTTVMSPSTTCKSLNDLGMVCFKGSNGNYVIPTTYVCDSYGTHVCARGGNLNGIGIETAVNMGSDVYLTWEYTAKHIANLLVKHNMTPDRVWFHNNFSNKPCPRTMMTANRVDTFLDLVYTEYEIAKNYSDYTITFTSSNPEILDNTGRVVKAPEYTTNVSYTVTVTKGDEIKTITLNTLVIGQYNL